MSESFKDIKLLQRQRLVNEAVAPLMDDIHALSMKTWTIEQWEKKRAPNKWIPILATNDYYALLTCCVVLVGAGEEEPLQV